MKKTIRIGGVPEHFNITWKVGIEQGLLTKSGFDIQWTDFPGGTGAMTKALKDNELDLAIILTEGAVSGIVNGYPFKLISLFVKSPLIWGIHKYAGSDFSLKEIKGKKYAISRMGSGSHLMACVDAHKRGLQINNNQFVIVNNLEGAVSALQEGTADLFLWEKFTTKPYVDKGIFSRIGECVTPWPCFSIAVRTGFYDKNKHELEEILNIIFSINKNIKDSKGIIGLISQKYKLKPEDVEEWIEGVEWAHSREIEEDVIYQVQASLLSLNIITLTLDYEEIVIIDS